MKYSKWQLNSLVILRMLIGWHFLFEGIMKIYNPAWTAKGYLLTSVGIFRSFFVWLANDSMIGLVDTLNIIVLIAVGAALLLGTMTRGAAIAGGLTLFLFYLAHPAIPGVDTSAGQGNYWIVNSNLIELAALIVIYQFPVSQYFGLDMILKKKNTNQTV